MVLLELFFGRKEMNAKVFTLTSEERTYLTSRTMGRFCDSMQTVQTCDFLHKERCPRFFFCNPNPSHT